MGPRVRIAVILLTACVTSGLTSADEPKPAKASSTLSMSKAIACTRIAGLDEVTPLPDASLTSEDKLRVYFKPLGYKVEPFKKGFRARFTEDGRVRRKGEKTPLSKEDKLLDHEAVFDEPYYQVYLVNTIGLKNLPPGEYEFDIILHDGLDEGATATQTLSFTIIPTPKVDPSKAGEPAEAEGGPAGSKVEDSPKAKAKAKGKAKAKRPRSPG